MTTETRTALVNLRAEVAGLLGIGHDALIEAVGVTNVRVLERRLAEADAVLAALDAAPPSLPTEELPCPFCGNAPESNEFYVWCKNGSHGPVNVPRDSWNRRTQPSLPTAREVLEDAPVLSKYHGEYGFEQEQFLDDYETWRQKARAALSSQEPLT